MPELRKDPIVDRWVIIAKDRAARPQELSDKPQPRSSPVACPFCEGNEGETTREILAYRAEGTQANQPGWRVRVVSNMYPALDTQWEQSARPALSRGDFYQALPAVGVHDVVIESPRHLHTTTQLTEIELGEVFSIYRQRLLELRAADLAARRLVQPLIFKNVGAAAGASIEHLHSQLMVLPRVPAEIAAELSGSESFYRSHGRCVYCALLAEELEREIRVVARTSGFVALCPFASRSPFETWIVPLSHASHYESLAAESMVELATITKAVVAKIESALDHPAYNHIIHTAPFDTLSLDHYHWHIEIIPRVTKTAGFEWGSGYFINPVLPEQAAAIMRDSHFAG